MAKKETITIDEKGYSFLNTRRKGLYATEDIDKAIDFLLKLRSLPNIFVAVENDSKEEIHVEEVKNVMITVRIEGKLKKISFNHE